MSKWQDEIYTSYKVESIILIMAAAAIGFLWKFLPAMIPFVESKQISGMYMAKIVSCLGVVLVGLGSYIFYLLKIPKYNVSTQQEQADIQRKELGIFALEEMERIKKDRQELSKNPKPFPPEAIFQKCALDGQEEELHRLSKLCIPPDMK